jgi:hypothetical protein
LKRAIALFKVEYSRESQYILPGFSGVALERLRYNFESAPQTSVPLSQNFASAVNVLHAQSRIALHTEFYEGKKNLFEAKDAVDKVGWSGSPSAV